MKKILIMLLVFNTLSTTACGSGGGGVDDVAVGSECPEQPMDCPAVECPEQEPEPTPEECPATEPAAAAIPTWLFVGQSNMARAVFGFYVSNFMRNNGHPISVLFAAEGSTAISCWRKGGTCYEEHVAPFAAIEGLQIEGILYWQGESDGVAQDGDSWQTYGQAFTNLIEEYRDDFGDVPFYYVRLQKYDADAATPGVQEPATYTEVRNQQAQALALPDVFAVDAESMTNGDIHPTDAYDNLAQCVVKAFLGHDLQPEPNVAPCPF